MKRDIEQPAASSWRNIRQAVNPRTMTSHGRRRLGWTIVRTVFSALTLGVLAGAIVYLWLGFEEPSETLAPVMKSEPLREVVLITDGVLDRDWVMERLALPEGIALMAIDLEMARVRLESTGQVRSAVLTREFPGTLVVTLEERVPVVRIMVGTRRGEPPEQMLVARDGYVYRGYNYDPALIRRLPWLDGVRLRRSAGGFMPIEGLERVSDLLLTARTDAPHLADRFKIVSLEEYPLIKIRTRDVNSIIFGPGGFRRQLARLDYILDHLRSQGVAAAVERIDLSVSSQVAVDLPDREEGEAELSSQRTGGLGAAGGNILVGKLPTHQNRGI